MDKEAIRPERGKERLIPGISRINSIDLINTNEHEGIAISSLIPSAANMNDFIPYEIVNSGRIISDYSMSERGEAQFEASQIVPLELRLITEKLQGMNTERLIGESYSRIEDDGYMDIFNIKSHENKGDTARIDASEIYSVSDEITEDISRINDELKEISQKSRITEIKKEEIPKADRPIEGENEKPNIDLNEVQEPSEFINNDIQLLKANFSPPARITKSEKEEEEEYKKDDGPDLNALVEFRGKNQEKKRGKELIEFAQASKTDDIKKYTKTPILEKFRKPTLSQRQKYVNKNDYTIVYDVLLADKPTFILKVKEISKVDRSIINKVLREYKVGRFLGAISNKVEKIIDLQFFEKEESITSEMLIEYCGEPLLDKCIEMEKRNFLIAICQLINTLVLMKEVGIAHIDIKAANIMWDEILISIRLTGLGETITYYNKPQLISQPISDDQIALFIEHNAAPECVKKEFEKIVPEKYEVFCFGLLIYELLIRRAKLKVDLERKNEGDFTEKVRKNLEEAKEDCWFPLIKICLSEDPNSRPTLEGVKTAFEGVLKKLNIPDIITAEPFIDNLEAGNLCAKAEEFHGAAWHYEKHLIKINRYKDEENIASMCNTLGSIYYRLSNFKKARMFFMKAEELEAKNSLIRAATYNGLGLINNAIGKYKEAIQHFSEIEECLKKNKDKYTSENIILQNNLGTIMCNIGNIKKSKEYFAKASDLIKYKYGEESIEYAATLNAFAHVCCEEGEYPKAIENAKKAESIIGNIHKENNQELINSYIVLGSARNHMKQYDVGMGYFNKAILIAKKMYGEEHVDLVKLLNNIGASYNGLRMFKKATEYLTEAEKIWRDIYEGEENMILASIYNNIGVAYSSLRDETEDPDIKRKSIEYLEQAIKIWERQRADSNTNTNTKIARNNLAIAYKRSGKPNDAIENLKRLNTSKNKISAQIHHNLGSIYSLSGNYDGSFTYLGNAIELKENNASDLLSTAISYNNLGLCFSYMGKYDLAIQRLNQSVKKINESNIGNYGELVDIYINLASVYFKDGKYDKAIEILKEALKVVQTGDEMRLSELYKNIGNAYYKDSRYKASNEYLNKAIDIWKKKNVSDKICKAQITICISKASLYRKKNKNKDAVSCYDEAEKILDEKQKNEEDYVFSYYTIGQANYSFSRYNEALRNYEKALKIQKTFPKADDQKIFTLQNNIATVYADLKDPKNALKYYLECERTLANSDKIRNENAKTLYENIADIYDEMKDTVNAGEYSKKAKKLR